MWEFWEAQGLSERLMLFFSWKRKHCAVTNDGYSSALWCCCGDDRCLCLSIGKGIHKVGKQSPIGCGLRNSIFPVLFINYLVFLWLRCILFKRPVQVKGRTEDEQVVLIYVDTQYIVTTNITRDIEGMATVVLMVWQHLYQLTDLYWLTVYIVYFICLFPQCHQGKYIAYSPIYQFIPLYFTPSSWALSSLSWAEMPGCLPHFLPSWVKWGRNEGKSWRRRQLETVLALLGLETFPFLLPVGLPCLSLYIQQCLPCSHCCCGCCLHCFQSLVSCRVRFKTQFMTNMLIFLFYLNYCILCVIFFSAQ